MSRRGICKSPTGRRTFGCVYADATNVHLVKDIGMIGNVMARSHGFESHFICMDRGRDFPYLEEQARWLELHQIPDDPNYRQFRWPPKGLVSFLFKNARSIDILQLFNHTRETMILGLVYKICNPKGFMYLKLDANEPWLAEELERKCSSRWLAFIDYLLPHLFLRWIPDLITAETSRSMDIFRRLYPWASDRSRLLPNGIDDLWLESQGLLQVRREDKEDVILLVGRIGTYQKNTEFLLDALEQCDLRDWRVVLAGTVEESFQTRIRDFFRKRPDLEGKVSFLGEIRDRNELYGWYVRAKVFCLTSRWEGFSLALVDAIHFGCHIVSTRVSSIDEVLGHGSHGRVVDTSGELAKELDAITSCAKDPLASFDVVRDHSLRFRWSGLCRELAAWVGSGSADPGDGKSCR